ncbi:MAG: ABC transporter permease subunit [Azospirillaceae bacterium]|nr:ABC transporter permease subunit [Azospirillaceae bacterium]
MTMMTWIDSLTNAIGSWTPLFLQGTWVTAKLLALSSLAGTILAVPLALCRNARSPALRASAQSYSVFFRGTPLLVQIFLLYYGLAQFSFIRDSLLWPLVRDAFPCALIALTLNMAAYVGEVINGGIRAVPLGEREAAMAMGMSTALMYRRIILPRAFRIMLPALSNEVVIQLKSTALASTVTVMDLTGIGRRLADRTYSTEPLLIAGAIYVLFAYGIARLFRGLEYRYVRR